MFSMQQLIKAATQSSVGGSSATAAAATSTASSNTASDLYKFLRQAAATRSVTSSTHTTTAIPKQQQPNESSQVASKSNFNGSINVSHVSSTNANGSCHGESESAKRFASNITQQQRQDIQRYFHTQLSRSAKSTSQQQQTTKFAMSSLAAEPLQSHKQPDEISASGSNANATTNGLGPSCHEANAAGTKPCFSTGLAEILQFMELIGNLKHTKRTGWVLRDVNDCESISGHMYRMSMLTFLLDGSEGLNQIRCMELALVHDLAESLVGDITPFCGVSKDEKRAMEFKAMEDICKLIEPRGKRIMELFEEYEQAESAESRFVKDLDRLDMVMQAFEYEKRDNCLLKHQEFFDSTEGKFNHPFVKKLVNEIYEQRQVLAKAKGATPPPAIEVPSMEAAAPTKLLNGNSS